MGIKDWPLAERPREKLLANGAHYLSDAQLPAVLMGGPGRPGSDAVTRARTVLARYQSLRSMLSADHDTCLRLGARLRR